MSNMSYCRFQNTLQDMLDCEEHFADELDGTEFEARNELVELCYQIAKEHGQPEWFPEDEEA